MRTCNIYSNVFDINGKNIKLSDIPKETEQIIITYS
jgi:hypothetical protein